MKKIYAAIIIGMAFGLHKAQAQVGIGTTNPNSKAILDLVSNSKGLLVPRLTTAERDAIVGMGAAENGMVIYNTTTNTIQFWNGAWSNIGGAAGSFIQNQSAVDQTADFRINGNGIFSGTSSKLMLGVTSTVGVIGISGEAAKTIYMDRNSATDPGNPLNIQAGGAKSGATNAVGGSLILRSGVATGNASSNIEFHTATPNVGGTTDNTPTQKMTLTGQGRLGIGTSTPVTVLHIRQPLDGTSIYLHSSTNNNTSGNGIGEIMFGDANNPNPQAKIRVFRDATGGAGDMPTAMQFQTTPDGSSALTTRMTIDNAGNIGVGTIPTQKLDLKDGNFLLSNSAAAGELRLAEPWASGTNYTAFKAAAQAADITYTLPATNGGANTILQNDGTGNLSWATPAATGWSLTGNAGIVDGTHFIGTTTDVPFNFKVNNVKSGRIENSSGSNVFLGYEAGNLNTGTNNSFFGHRSGKQNSTGSNNTAVGNSTLFNTSTGSFNVALGAMALASNDANNNVAVGYTALNSNSSGINNAAVGSNSLTLNSTGGNNTAMGYNSLNKSTAGNNTAFGANSGANITSGQSNTLVGINTMLSSSTALENTALGYEALYALTSGNRNTGAGVFALRATVGNNNTAFGWHAGNTNTSGSNNTFLGYDADVSVNNLTNATAIGAGAVVSASNSIVLGDSANIGIGTSSPAQKLELKDGHLLLSNSAAAGELRFSEPWASGTNYTAFKAAAQAADITYTLPATNGGANTILQNDGTGNLSWTTPAAGDNLGNHTATTDLSMAGNHIASTGTLLLKIAGTNVLQLSGGTGAVEAPNGQFRGLSGTTFSTPAYAFSTSTTTGMFNPAANELGFGANNTEVMRIKSDKIGIGTASPVEKLHINDPANSQGGIKITAGTVTGSTGADGLSIFVNSAGAGFLSYENTPMYFGTNGSNRMTLLGNGNFGVGITNPAHKLDVSGDINVGTADKFRVGGVAGTTGQVLSINGSGNMEWATPAGGADNLGNHTMTQNLITDNKWISGDGDNEGIYVNYNGDVGIGTTTPGAGLTVSAPAMWKSSIGIVNTGGGNEWRIGSDTDGFLKFVKINGTTFTPLAIDGASGNVGIGITNPSEKLTIDGNIQFVGDSFKSITFKQPAAGDGQDFLIAGNNGGVSGGHGGTVAIMSGNAIGAGNRNGGQLNLASGSGVGTGYGGDINILGGGAASTGNAGNVNINGGTPVTGSFGNITMQTGGGRVGIGTFSPVSLLSVGASSQFQVSASGNILKVNNIATNFPTTQGAANTFLRNDGSGNLSWVTSGSGLTTASNGLTASGADVRLGGTLSAATTISQAGFALGFTGGSIGIGTATPNKMGGAGQVLTVSAIDAGTSNIPSTLELVGNLAANNATAHKIDFIGLTPGTNAPVTRARVAGLTGASATLNGQLAFYTSNGTLNEVMRITEAGRVGIGTNPSLTSLLSVGAGSPFQVNASGNVIVGNSISIGTTDVVNGILLSSNGSREIRMGRNASAIGQVLRIEAGSPVAGATNGSGGVLELSGGISTGTGSSRIDFMTATGGSSGSTDNSPSTKMTLDGSGRLGIGTPPTPNSTLHVNGSVAAAITTWGATAITLDATHYTLIKTGAGAITFPAANTCQGRMYVIVNRTGSALTTTNYINFSGTPVGNLPANSSIMIQSDGSNWQLIK